MNKIIFSDVDGCMVDCNVLSYQLDSIIKQLDCLSKNQISVVLTTSKTAHEILNLNKYLKLPGPFIIENGHGILISSAMYENLKCKLQHDIVQIEEYYLIKLTKIKPDIKLLESFCPSHSLLTQMSQEELFNVIKVPEEYFLLLKKRYFTEPVLISKLTYKECNTLKKTARAHGLYFVQTKKFLHFALSKFNKGVAISFYKKIFLNNPDYVTFSIGDSLNDFSMFAQCDENYYITKYPIDKIKKQTNCHVVLENPVVGWLKATESIMAWKRLKIIGIMACNEKYVIADKNTLPWHCQDDIDFFREVTSNQIVIMGYKTYINMPMSFLDERINIIFTKNHIQPSTDNIIFVSSFAEFLNLQLPLRDRCFVIGGLEIIELFFKNEWLEEFYLTKIKNKKTGDILFPYKYMKHHKKIVIKKGCDYTIYHYFLKNLRSSAK